MPTPENKNDYYYDTAQQNLGLWVTPGGTKTFFVSAYIEGQGRKVRLGRFPHLTIEQARNKAREVIGDVAMGNNPLAERQAKRQELTLGGLFEYFLETHAKFNKKTWREDEATFRRYFTHLAKRKLSDITHVSIKQTHIDIGKNHGEIAANRALALIRTVFNKGIEADLWDGKNPANNIAMFASESRERYLQKEKLPRFFAALQDEVNTTVKDYFLLCLLTEVRSGNVCAMRWEQINFLERVWMIPKTKNGKSQRMPINAQALDILQQRFEARSNEWVFPSKRGSAAGHIPQSQKKAWKRICERANLQNLHIHDLRRTLASYAINAQVAAHTVGKMLNHDSPQATEIYARMDIETIRQANEKAVTAMLQASGNSDNIIEE